MGIFHSRELSELIAFFCFLAVKLQIWIYHTSTRPKDDLFAIWMLQLLFAEAKANKLKKKYMQDCRKQHLFLDFSLLYLQMKAGIIPLWT